MTVKFSVVGIFYNTEVDLAQVGGNTVGAIMDYLYRTVVPFYRTSIEFEGNRIISMIGYNHPAPFTSRSGTQYPAGYYALTQTFTTPTPNPYSVWQYYIADQNNTRVPVPGEQSFTQTTVQDGWSIVWRLVTVLNGPGNLSKRLRKLDPTLVSQLSGTP